MERGVAVEQGMAGWWVAESPPLEIGEEAPLEVDAESLLELEGDWEQMGGDHVGGRVASSSGISREVG